MSIALLSPHAIGGSMIHVLSGFYVAGGEAYRDAGHRRCRDEVAAYRVTVPRDLVRAGQVLQILHRRSDSSRIYPLPLSERVFRSPDRDRAPGTAATLTTGVGCDETSCFCAALEPWRGDSKGGLRPLPPHGTLRPTGPTARSLKPSTFLQNRFARGRALTQVDPQRARSAPPSREALSVSRTPMAPHPVVAGSL